MSTTRFGAQFRAAINWLRSRREVGRSGRHVFYSEYVARNTPERRYVEYADGNLTDSSHGMPTEWWAWLHNRRDDPPTEKELATSAARAEALQRRVKALEDEDRRQQLRVASGRPAAAAAADHAARAKLRLLRQATSKSVGKSAKQDAPAETEEFEREDWNPNSTWKRS